jgi:AcrR family transcriptional regulator
MQLKEQILTAAVNLAKKRGLRGLTRVEVAQAAGAATGTINYHFEAMDVLRNAVVEYAIVHEVLEVLAQARAERHVLLNGRLSKALTARIAAHISGR